MTHNKTINSLGKYIEIWPSSKVDKIEIQSVQVKISFWFCPNYLIFKAMFLHTIL